MPLRSAPRISRQINKAGKKILNIALHQNHRQMDGRGTLFHAGETDDANTYHVIKAIAPETSLYAAAVAAFTDIKNGCRFEQSFGGIFPQIYLRWKFTVCERRDIFFRVNRAISPSSGIQVRLAAPPIDNIDRYPISR